MQCELLNREAGVSPARSRHCKRREAFVNHCCTREGKSIDDARVRRPANGKNAVGLTRMSGVRSVHKTPTPQTPFGVFFINNKGWAGEFRSAKAILG